MYLPPVFFLLSTSPRRRRRSAEPQGPRSRGAGGAVAKAGTWHALGDQFGVPARRGQAEGCGTCARSARAAAAPALAPLALSLSVLHARAAERDQQLLSHRGSAGVYSNTGTSYAKEEAAANWACGHDPPPHGSLFSHPTSPLPFLPPLLPGALQHSA